MNRIWLFPFEQVRKGSTVVLYGNGLVGRDYVRQILETQYCKISFIVDQKINSENERYLDFALKQPKELRNCQDYDYVVVSVANKKFFQEILGALRSMGVEASRIVSSVHELYGLEADGYSQHGEDRIIYNAFQHMGYFRDGKLPSYIDVGAHHPYFISNTALFHRLGCRGVNVEANPVLFKEFLKERSDDINLCFGIGAKAGKFPFYVCEIEGLSTFQKENIAYNEHLVEHDTGRKENFAVEEIIEVEVRTLPSIVEEYCGGKWPDFMSIDIEGMEYETLKICDLTNGPKLIAVEVNFDGDKFVEMFKDKGYFPYLWYRENILFVRNDMEHLVHDHARR